MYEAQIAETEGDVTRSDELIEWQRKEIDYLKQQNAGMFEEIEKLRYLLRITRDHWIAHMTANLTLYGLPNTCTPEQLPGVELVRDVLCAEAPCGNGPLDRAIRQALGEGGYMSVTEGNERPPTIGDVIAIVDKLGKPDPSDTSLWDRGYLAACREIRRAIKDRAPSAGEYVHTPAEPDPAIGAALRELVEGFQVQGSSSSASQGPTQSE